MESLGARNALASQVTLRTTHASSKSASRSRAPSVVTRAHAPNNQEDGRDAKSSAVAGKDGGDAMTWHVPRGFHPAGTGPVLLSRSMPNDPGCRRRARSPTVR